MKTVSLTKVFGKRVVCCFFASGRGDVMDVQVEFSLLKGHLYGRDRGKDSDGSFPTVF
jgi:hypothetical protein